MGQPHQLLPIPDVIIRLPDREGSLSFYELAFKAVDIPPLGFKSYHVNKISTDFVPINPSPDTSIGDEVSNLIKYII